MAARQLIEQNNRVLDLPARICLTIVVCALSALAVQPVFAEGEVVEEGRNDLGLFLGVLVRYAATAGAVLLMLYYLAYPPFGASLLAQSEGGLYIVNKQLIEAAVLAVFALPGEKGFGIERLWSLLRERKTAGGDPDSEPAVHSRREALKNLSTIPVLGLLGWGASANKQRIQVDGVSGATIKLNRPSLDDLEGELPTGRIGGHEISRLVAGGNLIGGWAHSRDLLYVSSLLKAYNTEKKIFETLKLAEKAGINAINIGFSSNPILARYKALTGSRIKVISQVAPESSDMRPVFLPSRHSQESIRSMYRAPASRTVGSVRSIMWLASALRERKFTGT